MQTFFDFATLGGAQVALELAAIYATAAIFSGLSGFGFSAIGCLSLVVLPPSVGVALLMTLSLLTQAASFGSLWHDLRLHAGRWTQCDGVLPYLVGGTAGMPIGLAMLTTFGARDLTALLSVLLIAYATWSLMKPAALRLPPAPPSRRRSFFVGAAGGIVGGFSAFPGSALVVWNGLVGLGKEEGRALTQPFILWMQAVGLGLLLATRPQLFDHTFWMVLLVTAPVALLGNLLGVAIYRRTGDAGYRTVTLIALGVSGLGLLLKTVLV